MSAFTPYKKTVKRGIGPADLTVIGYPIVDWTCVLLGLPNYRRNTLELNRGYEKPEEPAEEKEKFFIKNILKSEKIPETEIIEKTRRNYEAEASKVETIVSNLGKSDDGHRCIYCGKIYSRKYGLKIHIRTHTGYKPLKCKYCLRPFGDPSNLNKHVRLHARGQTPYNCQFCGKVLVRRRDLERHIKSKHGEPS